MEEALLVKWLKQPGESVSVDEPVAEIETDKATMDIVSPFAGTLGPHLFEPGAVVPVGAAIARVLDGSEPTTVVPEAAAAAAARSPSPEPTRRAPSPARPVSPSRATACHAAQPAGSRRLARELEHRAGAALRARACRAG